MSFALSRQETVVTAMNVCLVPHVSVIRRARTGAGFKFRDLNTTVPYT